MPGNMALFSLMFVLSCLGFIHGESLYIQNSPCGDWIPYQNEQCIKVVERSGLQTKTDAEIICQAYAEGNSDGDIPRLITVKTKDKQDFLEKYLFEDNAIVDNVWLGLDLGKDGVFRWNDGVALYFTNWQKIVQDHQTERQFSQTITEADEAKQSASPNEHNCVKMASGDGADPRGTWVRANCQASMRIACEKRQAWSVVTLQNALLNFKLEFEIYQKEAQEEISKMKQEFKEVNNLANQKIDAVKQEAELQLNTVKKDYETKLASATQEINILKQNAGDLEFVFGNNNFGNPIHNVELNSSYHNGTTYEPPMPHLLLIHLIPWNFIYTQLPGQQDPSTLWPQFVWSDISSSYSGLFFRVVGGEAAPFGQVQTSSTSRLEEVNTLWQADFGYDSKVTVPSDGSWSRGVNSGKDAGGKYFWSLKFRLSNSEIRPRNQAIKVWQRIK